MRSVVRFSMLAVSCLLLTGLASADDLARTFKEAAARAKAQEHASSTSSYLDNDLMPYYGKKYESVLETCFATTPSPDGEPFSFVVAIGSDGKSIQIYRNHDTNISLCLSSSLAKDVFPKPPASPYYLHIDMSFSAKSTPANARPLSVIRDRENCTFGVSAGWKDDCDQELARAARPAIFPDNGIFEKSAFELR
jgi:hypothetical protein